MMTEIAPILAELANKVGAEGGSFVARVEWEKDEGGITTFGAMDRGGVAQQLTHIAAISRGNIDAMLIEVLKRFDCSQSIFLRTYTKEA